MSDTANVYTLISHHASLYILVGVVDGDHLLDMNLFFSEAKIQFTKYAAPLLYLSGMDVTVVEVSDGCHHLQYIGSLYRMQRVNGCVKHTSG